MRRFQTPAAHSGLVAAQPRQLEELLVTRPFKFLVGLGQKEFYVHRALVGKLSAPLNALVNGGMKEALEGCVTWDHVEEDIFTRFAQFAYTGAYTGFDPVEIIDLSDVSDKAAEASGKGSEKPSFDANPKDSFNLDPIFSMPTVTGSSVLADFDLNNFLWDDSTGLHQDLLQDKEDKQKESSFKLPYSLASYKKAADDWIDGRAHSNRCKHYKGPQQGRLAIARPLPSKRKYDAAACFCDLENGPAPSEKKRDLIRTFMAKQGRLVPVRLLGDLDPTSTPDLPKKTTPPTKTNEPVFIGHARLWIFADLYGITSLMDLACAHLVQELAHWTVFPSAFIADFGGLVRYVYDDHTVPGCQLRLLVAQFAACVVEDVSTLADWPVLLTEAPDFAVDLVAQMTSRFG